MIQPIINQLSDLQQRLASVQRQFNEVQAAIEVTANRLKAGSEVDNALELVCSALQVSVEELRSPSRKRYIADARHIATTIIYSQYPVLKLKDLKRLFNRDHATILNSVREFTEQAESNVSFQIMLRNAMSKLRIDEVRTDRSANPHTISIHSLLK